MDIESLKSAFPDTLIAANHLLAPHTTVKIGGPADIFIQTKSSEELVKILKFISEAKYEKITILGNGSNVLISDSGIRGIVIKNTANNIEYLPNNQVKVDSGVQLTQLITDTINHSLAGLEEFAYIPSTLGGAIAGNIHGVNKNNSDKFLVSVEVFNLKTGTLEHHLTADYQWGYDHSSLQDQPNLIVISATLQLVTGDPAILKQTVIDITAKKITTQSMNSLGSTFKNPPGDVAGRIIDQELGLKGFRLNDVQISPKHANFILNLGHATALNYLTVIKKVQFEAKSKLNLDLVPEIKLLGEF